MRGFSERQKRDFEFAFILKSNNKKASFLSNEKEMHFYFFTYLKLKCEFVIWPKKTISIQNSWKNIILRSSFYFDNYKSEQVGWDSLTVLSSFN